MPKSKYGASLKMGNVIQRERVALHMTQQDLSDAIDNWINLDSISNVELGKQGLSNASAERLMQLFKCDAEYLRGNSQYKTLAERQLMRSMEFMDEKRNEIDQKYMQEKAEYDYVLELMEKRYEWKRVGEIGIIKDVGFPPKRPSEQWIVKYGVDPVIPEHMNFYSQYLVFEGHDGKHIISRGELFKFTRVFFSFLDSGLRNLNESPLAAPGWISENEVTIHPKTLLKMFENGNPKPTQDEDKKEDD